MMSKIRTDRLYSVLLINTDTCPLAKVYPIGLDYLASTLTAHGYRVDTLDLAAIDIQDRNRR